MKTVVTNLSEQRLLNRLESMCAEYRQFDKSYTDRNLFVVKRHGKRFRIGRHVARMPMSRYDGYFSEFIYGVYKVGTSSNVEVKYRFGKPFIYILPFLIMCLISLPILVYLLYCALFNADLHLVGLVMAAVFSFIALFSLFAHSSKDRAILEEHLFNICSPKK